jgi:hypothetical protein
MDRVTSCRFLRDAMYDHTTAGLACCEECGFIWKQDDPGIVESGCPMCHALALPLYMPDGNNTDWRSDGVPERPLRVVEGST